LMKAKASRSSPPTSSVSSSVPRSLSTGFTTMLALLRPDVLSHKILRPLREAASPTRRSGSSFARPGTRKPPFTARAIQGTGTATRLPTQPTPGFSTSTPPIPRIRRMANRLLTRKGGGHCPPLCVLPTARGIQIWPIPPSTLISTPVMYDAPCDTSRGLLQTVDSNPRIRLGDQH